MPRDPIITGCGLVTSLGRSVEQTWVGLLAGRAIGDHTSLPCPENPHLPRVTTLAIEAAQQAIAEAGWTGLEDDTALIVGTSKGPVEQWLATPPPTSSKSDNPLAAAGRLQFGLAGMANGIAETIGLTAGSRLTLSAACASGLHALIRGCMMIQSGEVRRVLVVAAEASVHPLFLASFHRLGVLSPAGAPCRPFDVNRRGFLMSDAAAAVCLEASEVSGIRVGGFALGGDATHLTGSKSDGKVLNRLLGEVMSEPVDLIHAHGTGTVLNDAIELAALESQVRGHTRPILYSHKGAIGHSLGASGLVSVVLNCQCHRTGIVPGNVNTVEPIPHSRLTLSNKIKNHDVRHSIVIASGFGGPTAVVGLLDENPI